MNARPGGAARKVKADHRRGGKTRSGAGARRLPVSPSGSGGRLLSPCSLSILRRLGPVLVVAAVAATGCGGTEQAFRPLTPDQRMNELDRIVHERVNTGRSTGIVAGMV